MAVVSRERFLDAAQQQGVELDPKVENSLFRLVIYEGGENARIFHSLSHLALYYSDSPLAKDKWIDAPADIQSDLAASTLIDVINHSVSPEPDPSLPSFELNKHIHVGEPPLERERFLDVVRRVGGVSTAGRLDSYGVQIVTHNEQPVLLRKLIDDPSSLTLTPVSVGGLRVPAGSIVGTYIEGDGGRDFYSRSRGKMEIVDSGQVIGLRFGDLSRLALSPEARAETFGDDLQGIPARLHEVYGSLTIREILGVVEGAVAKVQQAKAA